jgi:hypothetical protein
MEESKSTAQHAYGQLNRQGYRDVKLHMIFVGAMGTIYRDHTDIPLEDLDLDYKRFKTGNTN